MVNGAGLAMTTMDIIKYFADEMGIEGVGPANFLDVGGGAKADKVAAALRIILAEPKVKAVLFNIFGGIMRCDIIASGIVEAAKEVSLSVPVVVRLEGTNAVEARERLAKSGLTITAAKDLTDAARKAVQLAKGAA